MIQFDHKRLNHKETKTNCSLRIVLYLLVLEYFKIKSVFFVNKLFKKYFSAFTCFDYAMKTQHILGCHPGVIARARSPPSRSRHPAWAGRSRSCCTIPSCPTTQRTRGRIYKWSFYSQFCIGKILALVLKCVEVHLFCWRASWFWGPVNTCLHPPRAL